MRAPDTLPPEIQRDLDAMDAAIAGRPDDGSGGDVVLAELAALLADDRPAPDPEWARSLDVRAAQGFDKHAPFQPQRARKRRPPRSFLAPALGLAACGLLAVVIGLGAFRSAPDDHASAGSGGSSAASTASSEQARRGAAPVPSTPPSGASGGSAAAIAPLPVPAPVTPGSARSDGRSARKVERSASMTLGTPRRDIDAVAGGVARVTTALGGFVASSDVSSRAGGALDLRVPSARLDDAIARLSRLGHVRRLERSTLDITAQSVSAKARIAALKAERHSLLGQLAKAVTLDEVDRLRARVRTVNHRLEAARAQSRRVDNRAAYANLTVEVVGERAAAAAPGAWSPRDAWHDALRVLEVAAGIALVALAVAVPLFLLGAPAWIAGRRLAQRRRERALDIA